MLLVLISLTVLLKSAVGAVNPDIKNQAIAVLRIIPVTTGRQSVFRPTPIVRRITPIVLPNVRPGIVVPDTQNRVTAV